MFPKTAPRTVEAIVNEQVHRWGQAQKERARQAEAPWPVITVSRELGSAGAAVSSRVADRLGFSLWDREVVHAIAEQTGAPDRLIATLDEHARGQLEDLIAGSILGAEGTADEYARQLFRTLRAIAAHGAAVIVGRGAHFLLAAESTLRVRVICPLDKRIASLAQRQGIDPGQSEKEIRQVEHDRVAFHQQRFGRDVRDPVHYDIVLNTGLLSVEGAADLVISAYGAKFGRVPPAAHAAAK